MSTAVALAPTNVFPVSTQRVSADRNPVAVYLAGLSEGSRRTMLGALERAAGVLTSGRIQARDLPWHELGAEHLAAVRERLIEEGMAPKSVRKILSATKSVLRSCWRLGLIDQERLARAVDVKPPKGETLPAGRHVDGGELAAIFRVCADERSPGSARDAALLAVLYGLRRAEVVSLDLGDYDAATGELRVLRAKGGKQRTFHLRNGAKTAIDAWLSVRGDTRGALFCPVNKSGRVAARKMTSQSVYNALRKRQRQAGVAPFSPHDLRRTFIGDMLDGGADISTVQQLVGHANVSTTQGYDRRPERTKAKAAGLVHLPYVAPIGP